MSASIPSRWKDGKIGFTKPLGQMLAHGIITTYPEISTHKASIALPEMELFSRLRDGQLDVLGAEQERPYGHAYPWYHRHART